MVEKRREALETKVERWKWALERVYLTRVLTRIVRLVAAASGSRSPSPPKSVFQSPSNALHCGVFKRRFTAAQDQRDHRRPVIFWYLARGKERRGEWRRRRRRRRKRGLRIRCFPLEFADGEAGNFYQRGNKGLWRWKGWLVETIYSSVFFFFFWKGVGGVSEEEDRMEVSVLRFRERKVKLL